MRSAQRKKRIEKSKTKSRIFGIFARFVIPIGILLIAVLFLKLNTKYWNNHDKFAFAFQDDGGRVGVTILDPALSEETTLIIPGDTEVNVARSYGTLRIKNVWQLGLNEKLGGGLLAQTLTDNFLFPTNLWSSSNTSNIWQFIFSPKTTNIPFGDRLFAGLFALKVTGINKTEIDLAKSQFLHKATLTDGKPGYTTGGTVSSRLTVYFSDNNMGEHNLRFSLEDATGRPGVADNVGQILEVLGGKVVAVDKKAKDDELDCTVFGLNQDAARKVARLFSCKLTQDKSNFDLEMLMGAKFAKRF